MTISFRQQSNSDPSVTTPSDTFTTLTPHIGDIRIAISGCITSVSSVSGGGVTTWNHVINEASGGTVGQINIFWGIVTGSSTSLTFTYSSAPNTLVDEMCVDLTPTNTASVSTSGTKNNATSSTTVAYPTLTVGSSSFYLGYAYPANTGQAGSTSGFTYVADTFTNVLCYSASVSGSQSPTCTQNTSGTSNSAGVVFTDAKAQQPGHQYNQAMFRASFY